MALPSWLAYRRDADHFITGNTAHLFDDGKEAYPAMLDGIRGARERILVEMYIFAEDRTGTMFRDALAERARAGVPVYVLYDAVGCLNTSHGFFASLADAGAHIQEYHPLAPWKPHWNWLFRDHRKLLIVDRTAFLGGMNFSDENLPREQGGAGWRDTQVRLEGPCVRELEHLFWNTWAGAHKPVPEPVRHLDLPAVGETAVRVLSSAGLLNQQSIRRSYINAIDRAQKSILITNAYFLPGRSIYRRLVKAARRGVKVRVLLPYETDHPYVRWASRALFGVFLENGVELYEYQPAVLHAKTAVFDGEWSTVGTHNLDHRSLRYNLEVNVTVFGRHFGGQLTAAFERDLANSRRLDLKTWRDRPFFKRLAEETLYQLRYAL